MTSPLVEQLVFTRKKKKIRQEDLAAQLDISQSMLSKMESGASIPNAEFITRWADALDLLIDLVDKQQNSRPKQEIYELRLFDTALLTFSFFENKDRTLNVSLISADKNNVHLLPHDLDLSSEGIMKWLKRRVIPKNREFAFEILHALDLFEADTKGIIDISMGLSVSDSYWIPKKDFPGRFDDCNLYDNPFCEALGQTAFTGKQSKIQVFTTSPELTTNGRLAKAWRVKEDGLWLYKAGTHGFSGAGKEPYCETYACQIGKVMGLEMADCHLEKWKGKLASVCPAFTSKEIGFLPAGCLIESGGIPAIANFYQQLGTDYYEHFCSMIIFDALIANEDRHFGNFGVLVDSRTNTIVKPAPLFDHGLGLLNYIPQEQMRSVESVFNYSMTRRTCTGIDFFKQAALYIGPKQKEQLRKVLNFHFQPEDFNFPKRYLSRLEKTIQKRARLLLELPNTRDPGAAR